MTNSCPHCTLALDGFQYYHPECIKAYKELQQSLKQKRLQYLRNKEIELADKDKLMKLLE